MATVWIMLASETVVALAVASAATLWVNKKQRKTVGQAVPAAGQTV